MKLYEIFEGVSYQSILSVAEKIVGLKSKAKFDGRISDADWQWLRLTCENQNVVSKLSRAVGRYITPTMNYNDIQDEFMRSGGTCAEALNFLDEIKRELDWIPSVHFEEGLAKTIAWYLSNENWLDNITSGDYKNYYKKQYS